MSSKWNIRFYQMAQLVASWSKDPSTQVGAVIAKGN
ncbi:MAG: dCMP deaminase family protein, partial [Vibrionaceae bacterium]